MSESKSLTKVYASFVNFFKGTHGKFNKTAILFTILNVTASFFFLSSLFQFTLNLSDFPLMIRQAIGIYILYAIILCVFIVLVMSLEKKYINFNINIFLLLYVIFQLPTLTWTTAIFFVLVCLVLYLYPRRQLVEVNYAKKVNIHRRVVAGLYMVIFISTIAVSFAVTNSFNKYSMNEVVDNLFKDNASVHHYMKGVYTKYLDDEKFQSAISTIEGKLSMDSDELFKTLESLPPELSGLIAPDMMTTLSSDMTKAEFKSLKRQIRMSLQEIKNVSSRDILIERLINVGSGQMKKWIAPYEMYVRFYFGYSIFAMLIILSPFLLILLSWLSVLIFKILQKGDVLEIVIEKQDVEVVKRKHSLD